MKIMTKADFDTCQVLGKSSKFIVLWEGLSFMDPKFRKSHSIPITKNKYK